MAGMLATWYLRPCQRPVRAVCGLGDAFTRYGRQPFAQKGLTSGNLLVESIILATTDGGYLLDAQPSVLKPRGRHEPTQEEMRHHAAYVSKLLEGG